jgi:hypothetical protein
LRGEKEMNFDKALNKMAKGKDIQSEVSKTIYSMEMEGYGKLFADGVEVKEDYITEDEMLGNWIEVKVARTEEEIKSMSEEAIKANLDDAYLKFCYDINVGRSPSCKSRQN